MPDSVDLLNRRTDSALFLGKDINPVCPVISCVLYLKYLEEMNHSDMPEYKSRLRKLKERFPEAFDYQKLPNFFDLDAFVELQQLRSDIEFTLNGILRESNLKLQLIHGDGQNTICLTRIDPLSPATIPVFPQREEGPTLH